jgi:hypothetical protein
VVYVDIEVPAAVFQQHQGFWILLFFALLLIAGFYVVQGLRKVVALLG